MDQSGTSPADVNGARISREETRTSDASGVRILLVEDNDMNQPNPAPQGRMTFDAESASAAITRLRALIEASDGGAVDALPAVEESLAGIVDSPRLDALRDALGEFDFEGALSKLAEISRQYGLSKE